MLGGCWRARTGGDRQGTEMFEGGGLKRPRPNLGCSAVED
jgi:hypothetical protein